VQVLTKRCGVHFWDFKRQVENFENGHQAEGHGYMQQYLASCCALHNWLLEVYGLDGEWEGAIG